MSNIASSLMGRTHGRPGPDMHPEEKAALEGFRRSIWQYGLVGLFTGACSGIILAPFARRFVGVHSNVATPLALAALFSTFGSAIAANRKSPELMYAMFKRQESMRAFRDEEDEKKRLRKLAVIQAKAAKKEDDFWG